MAGGALRRARARRPTPPGDPIDVVMRRNFDVDPATWEGPLRILAAGKAGELFFLSGTLPGLRERLPKARIIIRCVEHYESLVRRFTFAPDDVVTKPIRPELGLAQTVSRLVSSHGSFFEHPDGGVAVEAYRTHPWFRSPHASTGPFYEAFCDALCVPADRYVPPRFAPMKLGSVPERAAFAFVTANAHSSTEGGLRFTAGQWAEAAGRARAKGLVPIATGHHEDGPPPDMPGWVWLDCPLVDLVETIWWSCEAAVGCNSGITFIAARAIHARREQGDPLGPALMVDTTPYQYLAHLFDPSRMTSVVHARLGTSLEGWP